MRLGGNPPNTTVVNFEACSFVLLNVPAGAELILPDGWEVTEVAPLDLLRNRRCSQLNTREAKEALPAAAAFVV